MDRPGVPQGGEPATLRTRILDAFNRAEPNAVRVLNAGALEEELWTDENWLPRYGKDLQKELDALVHDGVLQEVETLGMRTWLLAALGGPPTP